MAPFRYGWLTNNYVTGMAYRYRVRVKVRVRYVYGHRPITVASLICNSSCACCACCVLVVLCLLSQYKSAYVLLYLLDSCVVLRESIASRSRPNGRRIIYDGCCPKGSQYEDRSTGLALRHRSPKI